MTQSHLYTGTAIPANGATDASFTVATNSCFAAGEVVAGIYSYENPVAGATKMEIKGEYMGAAWSKEISFLKSDGTPLTIEHNHLYRIILTTGKVDPITSRSDVLFDIEVLDWNKATNFEYSDKEFFDTEEARFVDYIFTATPLFVPANTGGSGKITAIKRVYAGKDTASGVLLGGEH